jgi:hypothetical protein
MGERGHLGQFLYKSFGETKAIWIGKDVGGIDKLVDPAQVLG